MKLSTLGAVVAVVLGLLTIAGAIYNAGRNQERTTAAIVKLCEQVQVLQHVTVSEHPEYTAVMTWKGCE